MARSSRNRSLGVTEAVILVGGKGTRLQSVVNDRPKPMAVVGGRPFVEWLLLLLRVQGVRRVVFCTGYMGETIASHFGDGRDWNMEFAYSHEPGLLGTGGSIRSALARLRSSCFFALNGDSYCPVDLTRIESVHSARRARATLWCTRVDDVSRFGSVEIDSTGAILAFREKAPRKRPGLVNAGVYALEREVVADIPEGSEVSLESDIFPGLIGDGLYAVVGDGELLDIGTPEAYAAAETFFEHQMRP
jgi:D-glycero-alpha-D-manno-heptose 1-phosphate guanylyltransferase